MSMPINNDMFQHKFLVCWYILIQNLSISIQKLVLSIRIEEHRSPIKSMHRNESDVEHLRLQTSIQTWSEVVISKSTADGGLQNNSTFFKIFPTGYFLNGILKNKYSDEFQCSLARVEQLWTSDLKDPGSDPAGLVFYYSWCFVAS